MNILTTEQLEQIDDPDKLRVDLLETREAIDRFLKGKIPEEEFKRFRLHRGIYSQRQDQRGYHMIRVKIPYGLLTSRQLRRLGEIARDYADGVGHITTRQDIQFHWVRMEKVIDVLEQLAEVGLTTREACGNTVRNIVGSPLAGVASDEVFDISPYAHALAKHLLRNPLNQKLPRKFKISFSGSASESDGIIPWIHDIGFVAARQGVNGRDELGFRVYVGGGLGAQPRVADLLEEFTPAEGFLPTAEAILTVFNRHGNRENRYKARMKFVIWKLGLNEFRRLVFEERREILTSARPFELPAPIIESGYLQTESDPLQQPVVTESQFEVWKSTNVIPQKQAGYTVVYVNPTIGDLTTDQFFALADISERFTNRRVRTTTTQDVVLRWIRTTDLAALYAELRKYHLHQPGANSLANVTSCPGADTCNLGITHSRALGKTLTTLFQEHAGWSDAPADIRIKISGCPNSCGQHHVAGIGFYGGSKTIDGKEIPSYVLLLGGGMYSGKQAFGNVVGKIPARRASETVSIILQSFLADRAQNESFLSYVNRVGIRHFRNLLKPILELKNEQLTDELFADLGQTTGFKTETGRGECAV
jgi:sulfite reductase beta subunit-like hemoprotein